ncbi:MAG TPA: T9SS type A sorting domain-containing protein [bacterium]|nr:T9SS type A sorting domain-containing protein [bacterium]HPN42106.1 T9SS type A sorting domain-containing protein [bacterium]
MKKIIVLLAILTTNCLAQIDTTALSFYPLHTGNYWEYVETTFEMSYIFDRDSFTVTITGDTLLTNGKSYQILAKQYLHNPEITLTFERVDSLTGNVYRYNDKYPKYYKDEYLIDSLKSEIGDSSAAQRSSVCESTPLNVFGAIEVEFIFNQQTKVKHFYQESFIPGYSYQLAENLGLYQLTNWGEISSRRFEMVYARVNGKEYGEKISTGISERTFKCKTFKLLQNYPNPFNAATLIPFEVIDPGEVTLSIIDISGRQTVCLLNRHYYHPGMYSIQLDARSLPAGLYFYHLATQGQSDIKKMLLIR